MKHLCITILLSNLMTLFSFGQEGGYNCSGTISPSCNYIPNPEFKLVDNGITENAFTQDNVIGWKHGHGTADINRYDLILPNGLINVNYASFHVVSQVSSPPDIDLASSEGIAVKTSPMITGKDYVLSFFRRATIALNVPGTPAAKDIRFKIVLAKCADFQNSPSFTPPYPQSYQVIYCESIDEGDFDWDQVFIKFSANDNYNLMWVFAEQNQPTTIYTQPDAYVSFIHFAYPQLLSVDDFTITWPNSSCNTTTLSPSCGIINAEYSWFGPNEFYSTQQYVAINTESDFGIFTLEMMIPNAIITNNGCSENNPVLNAEADLPEYSPWGGLEITKAYAIYDRWDETEGYQSQYIQDLQVCAMNELVYNTNELITLEVSSSEPNDNIWEVFIHSFDPGPIEFSGESQQTTNQNPVSVNSDATIQVTLNPNTNAIIEIRVTNSYLNETKSVYVHIVPLPPGGRMAKSSSMKLKNKNNVVIYPNPVSSGFKIKSDKKIREVIVRGIDGRVLKILRNIDFNGNILIGDMSKGMYLIETIFDDLSRDSKVIIKN